MPNVIKCPGCDRALMLDDSFIGKRARCPACRHVFVVPFPADDTPITIVPVADTAGADQSVEDEQRPIKRRRRDFEEEEEEARPRRSDLRRPRRTRDRDDSDRLHAVAPSNAPMIFAILALLCSCAPIIGFTLGYFAMTKADDEMYRLPWKRRYRYARNQAKIAKILGIVGMCLSFVFLVLGIILTVNRAKR